MLKFDPYDDCEDYNIKDYLLLKIFYMARAKKSDPPIQKYFLRKILRAHSEDISLGIMISFEMLSTKHCKEHVHTAMMQCFADVYHESVLLQKILRIATIIRKPESIGCKNCGDVCE